jgi:glycosyltransferase involved in cell wall biosynthesis
VAHPASPLQMVQNGGVAPIVSAHTSSGAGRPIVAIDTTPLLGPRTGIGHLVAGLVDALTTDGRVELRCYEVTWRGRSRNAQRIPMPARPLHAVWRRSLLPPIEWFRPNVDVVHGTNYVVPPARRARRVVSIHDLTALRFPAFVEPASIRALALADRAIGEGAVVHADSEFIADEIRTWRPAADVRVISPGIPTLACGAHTLPANFKDPLPDWLQDRRYVLALGTVEPRKDIPTLVASFAALPSDTHLVIAGAPGWGKAELTDAVDALDPAVRSRVHRLGYVDDPTRVALLQHAAVFAYPSLYEGFGLPVLEALSLGTPVVATTAGSLPEVCGDAALLVPPANVEALTGALNCVLAGNHPSRELGFARAATFTWAACAAKFADLYCELAP